MLKKGYPAIELRTTTYDKELIKTLIIAAMNHQPIYIYPTFRSILNATNQLILHKVIKLNKNENKYEFII